MVNLTAGLFSVASTDALASSARRCGFARSLRVSTVAAS
ncbi:Uncharacterised protein [Mycobacteroides abscessus subsp. abscessus]|nr:Uncharacterised protein [Mycobacteroides abscessus subsp. abscessus]SKW90772.1 Uncharacterised protein [Mycobacteroides abscessus subsp. abscessus]